MGDGRFGRKEMEQKLNFESDYTEGCHPKILERLVATNLEQTSGYGADVYTRSAEEKIREACQCPGAQVCLLTGGTQTNTTIIDSLLCNYEGVVCVDSGHIAVHEAGAVEAFGHKVLPLTGVNGKLEAETLKQYLKSFWEDENCEHMVIPGMVYLSHPTECGTLYTKKELERIHKICQSYGLPLFLDGARLGYGLMSRGTDVTLPDLARLTDVFYIGGTKVGALFGEAVVFPHQNMPKHFMTTVKRHGALLAKGRLLGIQFDTLFTENLYMELGAHGIRMAEELKQGMKERGIPFYIESPTNQQFLVLEDVFLRELQKRVKCSFWAKVDEHHTAVRFCTSWATRSESIRQLFEVVDDMGTVC